MNRNVIRFSGIIKEYGSLPALNNIDLTLKKGEVTAILGPNGAGKTTLVELIEGLREPTSGEITVFNMCPKTDSSDLKEKIGVQLQHTHLPPDLTTLEVLRLFGSFYREKQKEADVLEFIGLKDKIKTRVRHLSGGQKQRLAIGLALIHDPELVIFDEPTTGLDPVARKELHELILKLKKEGKTILLTTHYIEEAEKLCDRIIILKDGEIHADGTPPELVSMSEGSSTLMLLFEGQSNPDEFKKKGIIPNGKVGAYHRFQVKDISQGILSLGEIIKNGKLKLNDLRLKSPSLEDVYIKLVGDEFIENKGSIAQ
ncbi:MAG: ABC transporter ATP-binding protein [Acidobacteriota bacterium]